MTKTDYLYGYAGKRRTLAQMNEDEHWTRLHPEMRRRVIAILNACPHDLGIGNVFRTRDEQMHAYLYSAGTYPGNSYHEATDAFGYGLALDFLNYQPAIGWANDHAKEFGFQTGLRWQRSEPWHFQAIEIPASRRDYRVNVHTLSHWPLPGSTARPFISPWPNPPLRPGDRGSGVERLQRWLADWKKNPGPIDGIYGPKTQLAVEAGQREVAVNRFDPGPFDGIYGSRTKAAFDAYYKSKGWSL